MRHIRIIIISCCLSLCTSIWAQISTNEKPISFELEAKETKGYDLNIQTVTMPPLDMDKIQIEDKEDEEYGIPPRFGYQHKVDYNLTNSGTWQELSNGDKLWRLNVVCPNALSINICYDKFWIPDGGKLFVYSKDKSHTIGAFTSRNNKGDKKNIRGFATGLIYGNDIILEYYQPKEVTDNAIISIEYVVHGYRYINLNMKSLGDSGNCMVNVNCEEGLDWQKEKKAVALILVNGNRYCTGSLINTSDLDMKPYLLTADHCLGDWANHYIKYDAETLPDLDHYSFYWNYEAPGCANTTIEPLHISTSGATILANNSYSDFALLRLSEDPMDLSNYTPYYAGWDCSGFAGDPGVCIHHPAGDIKKISTVKDVPESCHWISSLQDPNSHWRVTWRATLNGHGSTQGGSSGSPLFNSEHHVIGQLHGGHYEECSPNNRSLYGKYSVSWTGNSNNSIYRRLNCWIDPLNTGIQKIDGLLVVKDIITMNTSEQLNNNIRIANNGQLNIRGDVELTNNGHIIVDKGGILIIDGGKLLNTDIELKPGSILRLINNGFIKTRNGFEAPTGAIVDMVYGRIL